MFSWHRICLSTTVAQILSLSHKHLWLVKKHNFLIESTHGRISVSISLKKLFAHLMGLQTLIRSDLALLNTIISSFQFRMLYKLWLWDSLKKRWFYCNKNLIYLPCQDLTGFEILKTCFLVSLGCKNIGNSTFKQFFQPGKIFFFLTTQTKAHKHKIRCKFCYFWVHLYKGHHLGVFQVGWKVTKRL